MLGPTATSQAFTPPSQPGTGYCPGPNVYHETTELCMLGHPTKDDGEGAELSEQELHIQMVAGVAHGTWNIPLYIRESVTGTRPGSPTVES